jgi:NAD(P)H-nitrite reductase large subunit
MNSEVNKVKHYVIIGNCVAAVGCIEGIRSKDSEGEITVISAEKRPAYCRPLISYYLEGMTDIEKMSYRPSDFYDRMKCRVVYDTATDIDSKHKKVHTENSGEFAYDSLCIATGSSPFVPPFEGLETVKKKFCFMTLDNALALEKALTDKARVFIVGAGLIGLKCAEGIAQRVGKITVCDMADRVLSSILDESCASVMQKQLEENGIEFMLGDSVERFDKNKAFMKSGAEVEFDILVLAVGVRARTALACKAGCRTDRGIIIDKYMKTDIPDIFAAGDCAQGDDMLSGEKRIIAIMPNAYFQGFTAGENMAGAYEAFDKAIAMNSIGFFGLNVMTAGKYEGEKYVQTEGGSVKQLYIKDGYLNGFIIIGGKERAGIYTNFIRERIPLETVDFETLKKLASNIAFSDETRRKKFGGVV